MSQRGEKYARNMTRRVERLEERISRDEAVALTELDKYGHRLAAVEKDAKLRQVIYNKKEEARLRIVLLIVIVLAVVILIVIANAIHARKLTETAKPADAMAEDLQASAPDRWPVASLRRTMRDQLGAEQIVGILDEINYFSAAIPLCWEYQDYMRTYCRMYECPYPLALAVADWETRGQFNMDAVGAAGEVGIFQLNPGKDGAYHAELEAATGLDPTTPEGNIAGGCYLIGKYLAWYEDITRTAMAYNMGPTGAREAWDNGITSTEYTDGVLEAMERWEREVNVWIGG